MYRVPEAAEKSVLLWGSYDTQRAKVGFKGFKDFDLRAKARIWSLT